MSFEEQFPSLKNATYMQHFNKIQWINLVDVKNNCFDKALVRKKIERIAKILTFSKGELILNKRNKDWNDSIEEFLDEIQRTLFGGEEWR